MAADLTLAGREVRLCEHEAFSSRFRPTLERGAIELRGISRTGHAEPALITHDFGSALDGARLVNVAIPAYGHDLFFESMVPHLSEEMIVILWAGDFGSLQLARTISAGHPIPRPTIIEASTLPYGARLSGPATVDILLVANRVLVAALPATRTGDFPAALASCWPGIEPADHVLQAAFANPNPIVHPPGCLLNVGRIEATGGEYWMYREGMTPAVRRVIHAAFREAEAVAHALGFEIPGYPKADFDKPASIMGEVFEREDDKYEVIADIKGPTSLQDRYLTEDLPFGLVPISQLGDRVQVSTPTIDAIIDLGSLVCERDFRREGQSLASLGLASMKPDHIMSYVRGT
jgi:opine dehydrogenase